MKLIIPTLFVLGALTASATTTINFSALNFNVFGDSEGNELAIGSLVQVGTYESDVFTVYGSGNISGFAGTTSFTTAAVDTTAGGFVGDQLAIRFFNASVEDFSDYGLVFLDKTENAEWAFKATAVNPAPPNQNQIDLGDLTDAGNDDLITGATLIRGTFGGLDSLNVPMFQTSAVPEPSAAAALAGLLALGYVMVRRRQA